MHDSLLQGHLNGFPDNSLIKMKSNQMLMCYKHLQHYSVNGEAFLEGIVTGAKTHYTPKSKQQHMVW